MCGIVGYTGDRQAAPILLEGLKKLEYRGYDSAGVAVLQPDGGMCVVKAKGRLAELCRKTDDGKNVAGVCGIGHTRWATHGEPSENNAHPHANADRSIVAVHNGIIENYAELKTKLLKRGYTFYSETDTEVAAKLVDYYYKKFKEPLRALSQFVLRVRGSYALAVMFKDYGGSIFAVRKDSPMIIGVGGGQSYIASDVPAILKYTRNVYYIGNLELARVDKGSVVFYNLDCEEIEKPLTEITWDEEAAEKGGYEHFMLKEIHEQPRVVADTFGSATCGGKVDFSQEGILDGYFKDVTDIYMVGCGSAYHAGVAGQYVIEELARIPVRVELASEFRYRNPVFAKGSLVILISQSGETADTLAALRMAKDGGVKTLAVVNVVGSSIAREADKVVYTKAGPEISVATTKAYSAQLVACYLLAVKIAQERGTIDRTRTDKLMKELEKLPEKIEALLSQKEDIQEYASKTMSRKDVFFIGRGVDYAVCVEGSLKLKEISYMHSEAYAAGELKHGTISLIEDGTLVIGVLTQARLAEKTVSNLEETHSRGAKILVVAAENIKNLPSYFDVFRIPATDDCLSASLAVIPLQLFAYYLSVLRGNDVDKPRNLAKSVTVE